MAKKPKNAVSAAKPATSTIYRLKITLEGIKPPIWRRVEVADCSLAKLHGIIQDCMGWTNSHLHVFQVSGDQIGDPEFLDVDQSSRKVKLSHLVAEGTKKFRYTYDMGDNWEHVILIEKAIPKEADVRYPRCTEGERACPPDDCGGVWGYPEFLAAISDPKHPEHEERLEWIGGKFDPEEFDLKATNKLLLGGSR